MTSAAYVEATALAAYGSWATSPRGGKRGVVWLFIWYETITTRREKRRTAKFRENSSTVTRSVSHSPKPKFQMRLFMVPNEPFRGKLNATSTHEILKKRERLKHKSWQLIND